jgi:hypothetical protein
MSIDLEMKLPDDMDEDYQRNLLNLIRVGSDDAALSILRIGLVTAYAAGLGEGRQETSDQMMATAEAAMRKIKEQKSDA